MSEPHAVDARFSLTVGAGDAAFHIDVELSLVSGVLVLSGPSGAGKTLTLRALAGLLPVDSGYVRVGVDTLVDTARGLAVPAHLRGVGYVPQHQSLFPFLDVAANVGFGLARALRRGDRARRWLHELGIAHLASRRPASLSGGERQRVALARALAVGPRLLLLDEPFASIDHDAARELGQLVREVIARHEVPAVLVTHDPEEARALGDRVVRFAAGRTVAAGSPEDVLARGGVSVRGVLDGVEATADGRARGTLRDVVVEGASDQLQEGAVEIVGGRAVRGDR
jgi:molybdate transport system ATP-binding protein